MNNFKSCVPCVCTGSGHKQVCERHDIGTQCGATATNTATGTVENIDATNIQQNQQNSQKPLTLRPLRTSILVPPAAYVSCWGVAGTVTHLSAVTQSCLLCRVASREICPTFIPFRHDKNKEWYGYCSFAF